MTAELQQHHHQQQPQEPGSASPSASEGPAANFNVIINQLREITGIQDPLFLHEALKAANGNLVQAVGFLTETHAKESSQEGTPTESSDHEESALSLEQAIGSADVTQDDEATLQEGIPCDVQDFQSVQLMVQDPNTAVNASCVPSAAESTNRSKRKRCEAWGEHIALNDWRRAEDWPVGLKNIGNTCWFSAVIQLPEFRRLVLSYTLPDSVTDKCCSRSKKRNVAFMLELQCLFALMLGTCRKFVDPTTALELLRGAFRSPEEQQQDVSEFTHKLLDWLEDAFQLAVNVNSQDKSDNPMVQLFYGTFLTEGIHEGKTFSKIETFGQYPLQVNGYKNLNECLEGAMVEKETEASSPNQPVQYRQERWFTKLPPVLTFELSRFEFNQSLGQPEKIHNKLEFPQIIYMDRFLYSNKGLIQAKREEIKKLKDQISVLQQKLEQYMTYGSGAGRFPLLDMLQYVLEFANARPLATGPETSTPTEPQAECQISEPPLAQSRVIATPREEAKDTAAAQATAQPEEANGPLRSSRFPVEMPEYPAPRVITENELHLVMTCLQRWRREVEQDINDLKNLIALLTASIDQMYCDPRLHQVPYHLHAVLVHEGQANAGHYWAYIYNQPQKRWLKYNDISVTESSWEELERDSFGGLKNASAYCLMYINKKLPHFTTDCDGGQAQREVEALSLGLQQYIQADNWRLEQEVAEWEEQASKVAQVAQSASSAESQDVSSDSGQEECCPSENEVRSLSSEHAIIAKDQTALAIAKVADAYEKDGAQAAFNQSREAEPAKALPEEANLNPQAEEKQEVQGTEPAALPGSQISEVEIPSVGKILVRSDADGYNEEVMLSPAMQGVILAIAKARQTFDRDGSEAGLVKAFHEEYSRLYSLSTETPTPQNDPRLQHVLVYLLQNKAPKQVVERTLLEQFADKNLSYDERSISIMQVARAKLKEIGPEEMNMEEYKKWHEDYSLFRKVSLYLLTGLEFYQNEQYCEALNYLIHAYENNLTLQRKGPNRGADGSLIALYRRKCLLKLNENATALLDSSEEQDVDEGLSLLSDMIIPCMHLVTKDNLSQDDLEAIEVMRGGLCDYMTRDLNEDLHLKLNELLARLFDCSAEGPLLKEPPKIRPNSPYDLCSRFAAVMESIHGASTVTVK
ncbi:LOW QUALITY PROTEIN: ubiquitin carboxyl-terminal hydrolase 28 [Sceloporus undulatus]|uniref:LOW QUALITY PROTEIN: ubiquitin carboxyl-terminal hydrolase 28 n=1 Tax=Sceloporus undulatus TaxID=8520 RepID=UPI001C4C361E|nr:LOW QUALITY PROTEIN: ubiquitin carboxyl-terminal hydrolase 28 [Sceloporus undulatus]